jgi:hypothetical protein
VDPDHDRPLADRVAGGLVEVQLQVDRVAAGVGSAAVDDVPGDADVGEDLVAVPDRAVATGLGQGAAGDRCGDDDRGERRPDCIPSQQVFANDSYIATLTSRSLDLLT